MNERVKLALCDIICCTTNPWRDVYNLACMQNRHIPSHRWELLLACEEMVLGGGRAVIGYVHTIDTAASAWEAELLVHLDKGKGQGSRAKGQVIVMVIRATHLESVVELGATGKLHPKRVHLCGQPMNKLGEPRFE